MKPETAQIIEWLRTGVQGSTKPNREKAAQCIEQLHGAVVTLQARICELEGRRLIGWRTDNFLYETDDRDLAKNWEPHIGVLPIFEGDQNTRLAAPVERPLPSRLSPVASVSNPATAIVDAGALDNLRSTFESAERLRNAGWMPFSEDLTNAVRRLLAGGAQ